MATELSASVDGVRLAELAEELPLGRSSLFELLKGLRIVSIKGPGVGGKGRVAWVSTTDANRLRAAARAVHAGEKRIADFDATITRTTSQPLKKSPAPSTESTDASPFLARLEAAERAVSSGLGLTTAETTWILGVIPGSSPLTRGGITATRTGKNCWHLTRAALSALLFLSVASCSSEPQAFKPGVEGRSADEVCQSTSPECQEWTSLARKCEENMRRVEAGDLTPPSRAYCSEAEALRERITGIPLSSSPGAYSF